MSTTIKMGFLAIFIYLFSGVLAFAQSGGDVVSDLDFFAKLMELVGGYKGLAGAALVLALVQLGIMFLKTPLAGRVFKDLSGATKLLLVNGLTILAGFLVLKMSGVPTGEALVKTMALPLVQEFLYQLYKQFIAKKV